MGKTLVCVVMLALMSITLAAEDQSFLGIFAETTVFQMAGMPAIAGPDDAVIEMAGAVPSRTLTVRLWSPGIAPEDAVAELAVPQGLKLGEKIKLNIYRPQQHKSETIGGFNPDQIKDFTIKRYFGSAEAVAEGQPEIIRWDALSAEQKAALRNAAQEAARQQAYEFKPDWTTAYWPGARDRAEIAASARLAGKYALTSYAGNVEIDVPEQINILAPIELSSPEIKAAPALDKAIQLRWKAIEGVQGYRVAVFGVQGQNTLVIWDAAQAKTDLGTQWGYLDSAQVTEQIKAKALLSPEQIEAIIPAGIFQECDIVFMSIIGYGKGIAGAEGQPLARVQSKTTLNMLLGGKALAVRTDAGGEVKENDDEKADTQAVEKDVE